MENRKFSRVDFQIEAEFLFRGKSYSAQVQNLSLKGALIKVGENIEIETGEKLSLTLFVQGLSTNLEIKISGEVIRKENNSVGVKFGAVDLDSFIHLRNIIAYNRGDYDTIMEEFIDHSM